MNVMNGFMGKIGMIDLSTREIKDYPLDYETQMQYIGGKLLALKLIKDFVPSNCSPFDQDNIIVLSTGPFVGTGVPSASRYHVTTISPLTNKITSSNVGGRFGWMMKKCGYDALVIRGKANEPTWLELKDEGVIFHDATHLWGKTTSLTQTSFKRNVGKMVIGPSGEQLNKVANLITENRSFGKDGMGAVFGSKNLKAITAYGTKRTSIFNFEKFRKWNLKINEIDDQPINEASCMICPHPCGKLILKDGVIIKDKELMALNKKDLSFEYKKKANELGLDLIHLIDLNIKMDEMESFDCNSYHPKEKKLKTNPLDLMKEGLSATGLCYFKMSSSYIKAYQKAFYYVTGIKLTKRHLLQLGHRAFDLENQIGDE